MTTVEQHRKAGIAILGELERAQTARQAARAVKREREWAAALLPLLEPAEAELMEPVSPFRGTEQIAIPASRLAVLGEEWAMAWQCHHARLARLLGIMETRLVQRRRGMATRPADDEAAFQVMRDALATGKVRSKWAAAGLAVPFADDSNGGTALSVRKRLDRKFPG